MQAAASEKEAWPIAIARWLASAPRHPERDALQARVDQLLNEKREWASERLKLVDELKQLRGEGGASVAAVDAEAGPHPA